MSSDFNFTHEDLMKLAERWHTARHEGDLLILQMLRISYFMSSDVLVYFTCYVQIPLIAIYVIALTIVVYIFIKEKMMAFLNILLVVSNILEIVPFLIMTPITAVFLLFAKKDVPVPSPWCNILLLTNNSIYHILHTIAINLKILLAINRICGVYFPLKFQIWFSRKRCAIYSFVAFALGGCIGAMLNIGGYTIVERAHLDDIWGDGYLEAYRACFLDSSYVDRTNANPVNVITRVAQIAVSIIFIIILIVCDIFLVVKLRQQQRQRDAIQTRSTTTMATENRINLLNRVCMWVLLVMIISALPQTLLRSYNLYVLVQLGVGGTFSYDTDQHGHQVMETITIITTTVLTPLDLFVFFSLSNKAKSRLKKACCFCKQW